MLIDYNITPCPVKKKSLSEGKNTENLKHMI